MTWEDLLAYCLAKPGARQDEPWEGGHSSPFGIMIVILAGGGVRAGP